MKTTDDYRVIKEGKDYIIQEITHSRWWSPESSMRRKVGYGDMDDWMVLGDFEYEWIDVPVTFLGIKVDSKKERKIVGFEPKRFKTVEAACEYIKEISFEVVDCDFGCDCGK